MISFLWQKMWKNKWMMVCLLIGNLLLVGIVAATPLYINATMRRILHQDMRASQMANDVHPTVMSLSFNFNNAYPAHRIDMYRELLFYTAHGITDELGVPVMQTIRQDVMLGWHLMPYELREHPPRTRVMNLVGLSGMEDNVNIVHGRLPSLELVDGNIIEIIVTEQIMLRHNLLLNELLEVRNVQQGGQQLLARIVGIYDLPPEAGEYWSIADLNHHTNNVLMSDDLILRNFIFNYELEFRVTTTWFHQLDYMEMTSRDVPHYLYTLADLHSRLNAAGPLRPITFTENFGAVMENHTERAAPLAITLWVLQVPIYVMLAFYIYMVSRQILKLDQTEISVLKSRGASRGQILGLYSLQGLCIAIICYPAGIWLGVLLCRMLGASNGFLELVQRTAIIVEITPDALIYAGLAMFLSFLTMFLPVVKFSKVGIVDHKRNRAGKLVKPLWQRLFLDILCLAVSGYALYTFNAQRDVMAMSIQANQAVDPLLLLSSSLFIMGLGLLCLRLFPYVVKLIFKLGQRFWSPATYASIVKVIRSAGEEQFIMIFLLFTLSVGTFNAQAARTVNLNNDHQIRYLAGADLTFQEMWRRHGPIETSHMEFSPSGDTSHMQTVFFEPDFERFTGFAEVDAITRVQRQYVDVRQSGGIPAIRNAELMAIETNSFGDTIWFRDDLLRTHINNFLNVLASRSDGVLLSDNFRTVNNVRIGDTIHFADEFGNSASGVVMGFVEHWPGFVPVDRMEIDGQVVEVFQPLIVANLGHLQTRWGVQPYHVWMRTNTENNNFFREFMAENRINITSFTDAKGEVVESRSDPILQGTNGVLTVGFIVTLLICFTGFLIYWILSIRSRVLQFGIFRAMGMSMSNLIGLLVNEQIFITFTAILLGALVGEISARLFVPLIQISYTAADQVIPLMIVTEARDYLNLYTVVGIMVVICLGVLAWYISKIKIAQALKLGED